jgi:diguanylate cyclase (GGDEF)-like protein
VPPGAEVEGDETPNQGKSIVSNGPTGSNSVTRPRAADLRRKQVTAIVDGLNLLPTSMVVPMEVLRLQRSGSANLSDYAAAITKDAGLAARVLGLVNSAAFSPVRPITRLTQAVPLVGLKNLMPLIFSISLGGLFNRLAMPPEERATAFRGSLLKAFVARRIAAITGNEAQAEEAFLCALFMDVGLTVLYAVERSSWLEAQAAIDMQDTAVRREREERIYGIDHPAVGQLVAERMGLPKPFGYAAANHHAGLTALAEQLDPPVARAVDVAATVQHRFATPQQALQVTAARFRSLSNTGDPALAASLLQEIVGSYANTLRQLGNDDDPGNGFKEFLQEISSTVAASVAGAVTESQATISGLKARESGLVQQVEGLRQQVVQSELDGLTNILTRAAFMRRMPALLAGAAKQGLACAVGYVDVDNFKSLNDTHGHGTGDAALQHVARQLTEAVDRRGLAGRIGGDEFVFALINRQPMTESDVVRQLGTRLTCLSMASGARTVDFSTSVGLIDIGVPNASTSPEQIFKWADELMYGVKKTGKGRCLFASRAAGPPAGAAKGVA